MKLLVNVRLCVRIKLSCLHLCAHPGPKGLVVPPQGHRFQGEWTDKLPRRAESSVCVAWILSEGKPVKIHRREKWVEAQVSKLMLVSPRPC